MPEFHLTADQIGELTDDGLRHPAQDIFGQPYDRVNATRKYFQRGGKRLFVVIPTGKDSEENTYQFPHDGHAAAEKPVELKPNVLAEALKAKDKTDG